MDLYTYIEGNLTQQTSLQTGSHTRIEQQLSLFMIAWRDSAWRQSDWLAAGIKVILTWILRYKLRLGYNFLTLFLGHIYTGIWPCVMWESQIWDWPENDSLSRPQHQLQTTEPSSHHRGRTISAKIQLSDSNTNLVIGHRWVGDCRTDWLTDTGRNMPLTLVLQMEERQVLSWDLCNCWH